MPYAVHRHAPLTLLVQYPDGAALMLDSGDAIVASGLRSGSFVEPVLESPAHAEASRAKAPVAYLTVLDDEQEGVTFLAVRGETTIGRDRSNRVELHDSGVSRRHAILRTVGDRLELEDLGSANGTARLSAGGERLPTEGPVIPVAGTTVVEVGTVRVRIDVGPPGQPEPALQSAVPHLQAPQVDPVFAPDAIALPSPPDAPEPTRFPLIAMLAPLVLGSVLFLATQSVLSLIFIALSPIIMIGTWLDNLLSRRRANRAKQREFGAALGLARQELEQNREQEQQSRGEETPPSGDLAELPTQRAPRLWGRRPEHRAFLELRLGNATLPSRKQIELPPRGSIPAEAWEELLQLHERYRTVQDVPMLERLDRCGSLGIAGHELWAGGAARSVLVQLLSQHSPADLVFTAFADPAHARGDWAWLKWIPHVDSAFSPIRAPHLVADERSAGVLLTELEGLIHARTQPAPSRSVRSRMTGSAEDGKERLTPVGDRAVTPAIIVFVLSDTIVDRTRLVGLAEDGPDAGVHVIWVAEHLGAVPAACRTTVEALPSAWRTHFVRQGEVAPLTALESVDLPVAERFGRALAPILDAGARVLDESDFPRSVPLAQIVPGDILDSGTAVLRNWEQTDSLVSRWGFGAEREAGRLAAVVGQGSAGPVEIDLRVQGPHALVGGTTGSGKSEFLQSWIFSLAGNYAPDRVTFLLVDYKGGAAFSDCVDLPHTVGLVTDLNTHLVRRALTSLRAELRYREELLAEKGAKDLVALERRGDPEAPPALVIVIDEFAALVNEIPEFVDGVIDVAQRGRSLGLHLVMATQRPAGVIKDNLRANTNLRIALRMADATDSSDVIGVNDAAGFSPDVPGRAAMRIGAGRLTHFQSGYLGGRSDSDLRDVVEIRDLEFGEHSPWTLQPEVRHAPARATKGPTDIEVLAANIRKAAEAAGTVRPRRPWVDQLPEFIPLGSDLLALRPSARERETTGLVVGLIDEPHLQRQSPYEIPLAEVGNVAIFGGAGSGKTTALITAACASIHATPETQIYGVDCGGGRLGMLASLPNTGDIVPLDERDRVVRLLRLIRTLVAGRVAMRTDDPPVLLFIDGFAAFRDAYEHHGGGIDPFADLVEIARGGRTVGVHVLLTSERSVGLPTSLAASVPERLVLRLPAEHDYNSLGVPTGILENAGPGRALRIGSNQEIQLATPGTDPADTDTAIKDLAADQQRLGITRPPGVAAVPESLRRTEIPHELDRPVPFAIDTAHLAPVPAPEHGFLLVTGPAGSGRTTTIRSLLEAFEEDATRTEQQLDATLLSPRRSSLRDLPLWGGIADTVDTRDRTIAKLIRALGGHSPKPAGLQLLPLIGTTPQATPEEAVEPEPIVFPAAGRRGIVVIEDIGGFDGSGNEQQLATLLKLLRRSDITTIIEGENATLSSVWELTSPLRGARWAIALQPDANDVPSLFSTPFAHAKRAESPAGRGYLIRNGTLTGVHIGLPDTHRS
ncbi:FtsK/SpoIIIE domain-containing protein [Agromyces italicus]|uniref:FtsK/SpoIIIE domain-containing protein n=1 Tax=Agromyces italicus TaxID=279572 RepID=UPI0012FBF693|nr:FtsK/SpoIIIE domain-containing protein [Agromyces italicus]